MKKITTISKEINQNIWNQKALHPLQSWEWGETRKKMGIEVLRLGEFGREFRRGRSVETHNYASLINVYQLTFHKIPYTSYKIGYLPRSVFPSEEALEFLGDYGRKNKVIFIKIEPYTKKFQIPNSKFQTNFKTLISNFKNLKQSPHPLFPNWTIMVDLTKSEEELLKKMKPKTRYNIRLAQKKGVVVREMTNEEGFKIFAKLYFETCRRQKYYGHNYQYHKIIFETLREKIAHILIAFYKNTPLSAYEIFVFNDVLYYPYGGSSLEYRNLMGANLLMWETIRFGQKKGAKIFDMWGSLAPNYDQNNDWAGFTRFKEGYGGNFVELVGSYDLVVNPSLYFSYNLVYKIRQWWLKVRA